MIPRFQEDAIKKRLFKGKAILLLGPRQVGKTTLVNNIRRAFSSDCIYLNGDEPDIAQALSDKTSTELKALIGNKRLAIIDEAQRVRNIGISLKLLVDNYPDIQVIATGSSSLELGNEINEPLTGRKFEFFLFPVSYAEMEQAAGQLETRRLLKHRLIFGYYPEVINNPGDEEYTLRLLANSYLYKDLFMLGDIRKPDLLQRILQALAFQIGSEVSYNEIGQLIGADNQTVERYINLLEKSFVIFRVGSFSRNLRNELKRSRKIYFWDNGIRNTIISNFNAVELRPDTGALWENFLASERQKLNAYRARYVNHYFWRTHAQQEIDYLEETGGKLFAYEFCWNPKKRKKIPPSFQEAYPGSQYQVITPENYREFITGAP